MLWSGSSSAVSSLKRSVTPVVASPGLLSSDSFLCLMAWRQSKSSLADSCSSEKNWGVVIISASFCCTFLVKDLKAVLASGHGAVEPYSAWVWTVKQWKWLFQLFLSATATVADGLNLARAETMGSIWGSKNSKSFYKDWKAGEWARPSTILCLVQEQISQVQR